MIEISKKNVLWESYKSMSYIDKRAFKEAYMNEFGKNFQQFYKFDSIISLKNMSITQLEFFAKHLPISFEFSKHTKYEVRAKLLLHETT